MGNETNVAIGFGNGVFIILLGIAISVLIIGFISLYLLEDRG